MKVELIAATRLFAHAGQDPVLTEYMERDEDSTDAETLTTFSGRKCYESLHRPNPATARDVDYIQKTALASLHWSITEHSSFSFLISEVGRDVTHELVRHRMFSFSQNSQRYMNYSGTQPVYHPSLEDDERVILDELYDHSMEAYDAIVQSLMDKGYKRKGAREAARAVLPNATPTDIVMTGNIRAWYEFLEKRNSDQADRAIREVALEIKGHLEKEVPSVFKNMSV